MKQTILLIDVGNRRLKWAAVCSNADGVADWQQNCRARDAAVWTAEFYSAKTLARRCGWDKLPRPVSVWVACVANPRIAAAIEEYASAAWGITPVLIRARAAAAGVVNGYAEPHQLGADRWAALVAAAKLFAGKSVIVVDAGTAVTVDLLAADGRHHGGVILPGAAAMRAALCARVAEINPGRDDSPWVAGDAPLRPLAADTQTAVAGGAWLAVVGGVELTVARMREAMAADSPTDSQAVGVALTGGDAARLASHLSVKTQLAPDLVLRGLAILAGDG